MFSLAKQIKYLFPVFSPGVAVLAPNFGPLKICRPLYWNSIIRQHINLYLFNIVLYIVLNALIFTQFPTL